jgi:hypothetical protein
MKPMFLGAYWGPRAESVERCAVRFHEFLTGLQKCDESFSRWYERKSSQNKSLQSPIIVPDLEGLANVLMRGQNRANVARTVAEDLGFQVGLWNGETSSKYSSCSLQCGLYWKSKSPESSLGNCVVLDLPAELSDLSNHQIMSQALAATIKAWEPDWAGVVSEASMQTRKFDVREPFVDWIVYVPHKVQGLGEPSVVSELQGYGSIIIVQPSPPVAENMESQLAISRVETALRRIR